MSACVSCACVCELAMPDTKVNSRAGHKTLRVRAGVWARGRGQVAGDRQSEFNTKCLEHFNDCEALRLRHSFSVYVCVAVRL